MLRLLIAVATTRRPVRHGGPRSRQQMDETFLRGSERFSELLARGDVAPCPDHLDRDCPLRPALQATRAVPGTLSGIRTGSLGAGSVVVGVGLGTTTGLGIVEYR